MSFIMCTIGIVMVINLRIMSWLGHVVHMEEMR
jgi:hypothetical protein